MSVGVSAHVSSQRRSSSVEDGPDVLASHRDFRPATAKTRLTIYALHPLDVVLVQREVVRVHPPVQRRHDGAGVIRMLQTQSVTQLVDRHQEEIHTCRMAPLLA